MTIKDKQSFWKRIKRLGLVIAVVSVPLLLFMVVALEPREGDPPLVFARMGALEIRDIIERNGKAALDRKDLADLLHVDGSKQAEWLFSNKNFQPEDWTWRGKLSDSGRFVGVVLVDGRRRLHGRSFSIRFWDSPEKANFEVNEEPKSGTN